MASCVARAQSSPARLAAILLAVIVLADSAPAFAKTTVDANAKPWLIGGGLVAILALSAAGAAIFRAGWRMSQLGEATRDWPTASGQVISAE